MGGAGAPDSNIYVVTNRAELKVALENRKSATWSATDTTAQANAKKEAKIIYLAGTIYGTDLGNGKFADEAYYKAQNATAANWDWNLYIQSLDTAYMATLNASAAAGDAAATAQKTKISALSSARTSFMNIQKEQIQFIIPSNTTILGVGADAKIVDGYFSINATNNIVIRNLEFQAPLDLAPSYTTTVGKEEWNARYKAISVVTGKQVWIDHCTFSDGANQDTEKLTINGVTKTVQRHDGLLDIEDSSDYFTVSYSVFKNHDKTNMVGGSGDGNGGKERAYNRLTFSNNIWQDSVQRAPRARFGQIHLYNNSYGGNTDATLYATSYYIGMGAESRILSEANVFDMSGSNASVTKVFSNLNGYQFKDVGSWFNGVAASTDLEAAAKAALDARYSSAQSAATSSGFTVAAYTNELGWTPPYSYTRGSSAADVRSHNLANAGVGKLVVTTGSATRPMLDDTVSSTYTVAKALAGSDAWMPQSVNAGQPNAGRLYPAGFSADYVVDKNGTGTHATIQAALNAASTSTAARVYIQIKAGNYNEQLIVSSSTTTAITLYSSEADAGKVRINNALSQGSLGASYNAFIASGTYAGNTDATTLYTACSKKAGAIGKECAATIRVRNNGFQLVNLTVENAWVETGSNDQAVAVMIDKADKVVLDGVRLMSNQDTLYLANSGKRVYVTGSDIAGDVDFIFGAGIGVFEGSTIRTIGTRKPSGTSITSPSTTASSQIYGLLFNNCVFLADSATTDDSIYLARQWDDGSATDASGKTLVRNSVLGKHVALTNGPWSPTVINGSATIFANGSQPYLIEYRNWQMAAVAQSGSSSSAANSSAASSVSSSAASSASSSVAAGAGSDTPIAGSTTLANAFISTGLPTTVATTFDSATGKYSLVSAGSFASAGDTLQFAYKQVAGDFTLVANLNSMEVPAGSNTGNVRAGLMIRSGLGATARYYSIVLRGSAEIRWEQRLADGGSASSSKINGVTLPTAATPIKLKLQRTGQIISVSYSVDGGTNWLPSPVKTQDFSTAAGAQLLDSSMYVGLIGVSGTTTVTSVSEFANVSITQ